MSRWRQRLSLLYFIANKGLVSILHGAQNFDGWELGRTLSPHEEDWWGEEQTQNVSRDDDLISSSILIIAYCVLQKYEALKWQFQNKNNA